MKKIFFFLVTLFFLLIFPTVAAGQVPSEAIQEFRSEIRINKNATIDVFEYIRYDFGLTPRHGIFREIPYMKKNKEGKRFVLEFEVKGVANEKGQSYPYEVSKNPETGILRLKIGDPDKTITGINTYIIGYHIAGALTYFSDHDELYWNVTGNDWTVPIATASAEVKLPHEIEETKLRNTCFTGPSGSTSSFCSIVVDGQYIFYTITQPLESGEGLTFVAGLPKGIVEVLEPQPYITFADTWYGKLIIATLVLAGFLIFGWFYILYPIWIVVKWFRYGRDPKVSTQPVRAWFNPPKTPDGRALAAGEAGALIDETVQLHDITASIVDLARRGYLKIEERKKKDFYFTKTKEFSTDKSILPFEKKLLQGIFGGKTEVRLKDEKLYQTVEDAKTQLYEGLVAHGFFKKNPRSTRTFYLVVMILAAMTFNPLLFVASMIFGRAMPAKTKIGAEAANIAKSLKNFLTSQERQLAFQAKNQMMFEKLLPYAVAFGVEKIWADRFKDINLKSPEWYSSYDSGSFNSVMFSRSLNSSFASFASSATSTTSSSGFSSGFSGGGSSGGGGGGGGGGSW